MSEGGSRHGVGRPVPSLRRVETDTPLRAGVVDVDGDPVADAALDALVCGWRRDEPTVDRASTPESVTVAYCQWGAEATTDGAGVGDLGPFDDWSVEGRRGVRMDGAPPLVDPARRIAAATEPDTSGTQAVLVARYQGQDHLWFGARRLSVERLLELSDGGTDAADLATVELAHKRLYAPEPLAADIEFDDHTVRDYEYGALSVWQTVPSVDGGTHELNAEIRSGLQSRLLGHPDEFPELDGSREFLTTVDAFDRESARIVQQAAPSGGLRGGSLSFDIDEPAAEDEERVISLSTPGENDDGTGRDRTISYYPQVQKLDDPAMYTLTSALSFELAGRMETTPFSVPLQVALPAGFTGWRSVDEPGDDGDGGGLSSTARSVGKAVAGEIGEEIEDRANYTAGVVGGEALDKAVTALDGLAALSSLATSAVEEPANDITEGAPPDPNTVDRLRTSWRFGANRQRLATVLTVPFTFENGSSFRTRVRGGWGSRFYTSQDPSAQGTTVSKLVGDRVNRTRVTVTDRRVPARDPGSGRGGNR